MKQQTAQTDIDYQEFLKTKNRGIIESGFEIDETKLNGFLFPFQKQIVRRALQVGRYAIFADCGLGKTIMQLEFANQAVKQTGKPALILAPLAVTGQTIDEGNKFGIPCQRYTEETKKQVAIHVSNYEQLDNIDVTRFSCIVLDESSMLKNFTGKTKKKLIEVFSKTPYRLCCTATPSPNDINEIGNHSEFLGILDAQDMRSKWFVRDEGMNNYRLKGHGKKDFYAWVSSWATMITKPQDLGFEMEGYVLPKLEFIEVEVSAQTKENGQLFNSTSVNATEFNAELRYTMKLRLDEAVRIAKENPDEQIIIWIKHDAEADYLKKALPEAVEVRGSDKPDLKEKNLLGFARNEFKILITKAKIAQFGLNYQNCALQINASLDFSFEGLYQTIRRSYRFGQKRAVRIYLITSDTMTNVINTIKQKEQQFLELQTEMNKSINVQAYGLLDNYEFKEKRTDEYWLMKGDSCQEIKRIPDNSIDFIVFSPPFSSLFTYSNYIHDMGNSENHEQFFKQYSYLLKDLYRILKPGRLMACHTKDMPIYKGSHGYTGLYDFTGEHHRAVEDVGFKYHAKINIWTDPVLERSRTNTQRLLYHQVRNDSSYSGVGLPEYVTIFRKWEGNEEDWTPINNKKSKEVFPLETWQAWASPVWQTTKQDIEEMNEICEQYTQQTWFDIKRTDVLNNRQGFAMGDEKHIAPLQLSVIRRCVQMWTNKGETVFTPFLGIGSEVYESVKLGRKGIGCELKDSYFETACKNVQAAVETTKQMSLF